jgi:hypothetical protein
VKQLFPKVRDELGRSALGDALQEAKKNAPTHPHPRSPDSPPGNLVIGAIAAVVDRAEDTISGAAQGGLAAVQDLVNRLTSIKRPVSSPRGSTKARAESKKVREAATAATDKIAAEGRAARARSTATAKAAKSGAKATAKTSARAVGTTTKRGATSTRNAATKKAAARG